MPFNPPGPIRQELPPFDTAPAAGGVSTLRIPVGPTYDALDLVFEDAGGGRTEAEIGTDVALFELLVGSEIKVQLTGPQLTYLCEYYMPGSVSAGGNGRLRFPFARRWLEPVSAIPLAEDAGQIALAFTNQDGPAWGTQLVSNVTLRITWAGASGCTAITPYAETREGGLLGTHITMLPHQATLAGAGVCIVRDIPLDPSRLIAAMHIDDANVTNIRLRADNSDIVDIPIDILNDANTDNGRLVAAGFASLDFMGRNRFADCLPETMRDLRLEITFGVAPGDFTILIEEVRNQQVVQVTRQ